MYFFALKITGRQGKEFIVRTSFIWLIFLHIQTHERWSIFGGLAGHNFKVKTQFMVYAVASPLSIPILFLYFHTLQTRSSGQTTKLFYTNRTNDR